MNKTVTIELRQDELDLLDLMRKTIDFYGQGYDDRLMKGQRKSGKVFGDLVEKLKTAYNH